MIKFVPGFVGAIAAYVVLKLFGWLQSVSLEALVFFGTYLVVTIFVHVAMTRYGEHKR